MKKHLTWLTLFIVVLFLSSTLVSAAKNEEVCIWINGEIQEFENPPFISKGMTLIPLRGILEGIGASVEWCQDLKEIKVRNEDKILVVKIGSASAFVNSKLETMPHAPLIIGGVTMVPLRFVSEALGFKVEWISGENRIDILTDEKNDGEIESDSYLTYEQAVNLGIRKSPEYNGAIINAERAKKMNDDLFLTLGTYNLGMLQMKKDLTLNERWQEVQLEITADRVGNQIINQMDSIGLLTEENKLLEDKIDFLKYKNRIEKLKYDNGLISMVEYTYSQTELEAANQEKAILKNKTEGEYLKLEKHLAMDIEEKTMEYNLEYREMGTVDLEKKIEEAIAEDPYIWYAEQNFETKEFKLVTYEYNIAEKSYSLTALDLREAKKNLKDTKDELANVIRQRYQQVLQIEENIKTLELQLDQAKRGRNLTRLQYDAGMVTKAQVEETQITILLIEHEIRKLKQSHTQLKVLFERPYLAPEYFSYSM